MSTTRQFVVRWLEAFLRLWHDCSGAALIEYSFVIGFMIAMIVVGISRQLGFQHVGASSARALALAA